MHTFVRLVSAGHRCHHVRGVGQRPARLGDRCSSATGARLLARGSSVATRIFAPTRTRCSGRQFTSAASRPAGRGCHCQREEPLSSVPVSLPPRGPQGAPMPSSLRELLDDHPNAAKIARVLDPRPHSQPGWRQQRFEDSYRTFSQLALGLPEGVALADTAVMGDKSLSVETVAIVRERVLAIVAVIAALPADERAVIAAEADAMAIVAKIAGIGSVRTAWRRLASARAAVADAGVSDDELAAVLDFLPPFSGAPCPSEARRTTSTRSPARLPPMRRQTFSRATPPAGTRPAAARASRRPRRPARPRRRLRDRGLRAFGPRLRLALPARPCRG